MTALERYGWGLLSGIALAVIWFLMDKFLWGKPLDADLYVSTIIACAFGYAWGARYR